MAERDVTSKKVYRQHCPVCGNHDSALKWIIPFRKMSKSVVIDGVTVHEIAVAKPWHDSYQYLECVLCGSVYLSPLAKDPIHRGTHYIDKMKDQSAWLGYELRYDWFKEFIPKNATVMVDAAGAVGQYVRTADMRNDRDWSELWLLEGNETYVHWVDQNVTKVKAIQINLTNPPELIDLKSRVDLVVFSEAFEHMFDPGATIRWLASLLSPVGIIFFTAQTFEIPVRPSETIYASEDGLQRMLSSAGLTTVKRKIESGRFHVITTKSDPGKAT